MWLQQFAGEKTEPATPKRREEARRKGQVAKSPDLTAALILLGVFLALKLSGPGSYQAMADYTRQTLTSFPAGDWKLEDVSDLFSGMVSVSVRAAMPIALTALVIGLVVDTAQVGFNFTMSGLSVDFGRINPAHGFQRMFSRKTLIDLLKAVAKAGLVGWIVYSSSLRDYDQLLVLAELDLSEAFALVGGLTMGALWRVGLVLLILAGFDYWFQRVEFERSLKMSKQEVKEETKSAEGDPAVKARIRERQRAMSRQRMMQQVPKADVVVTNPIHYAVALKYEAGKMEAPEVVAKGQGYLAQKIKEIAVEYRVEIVENKPLAQALYKSVEVGDTIPGELYGAVAEVLAFVYKLKKKVQ